MFQTAFLAVHRVEGPVALGVELDVVENEKLRLRPENGRVGQARAHQIFLGPLRNAPRVAAVGFLGPRLRNGAGQDSVGTAQNGSMNAVSGIRHRQHVGGLDGFPAADGRTVKTEALLEDLLRQFANGTLKCCQVPNVSTNLTSTIFAPAFLASSITLLGVLMF